MGDVAGWGVRGDEGRDGWGVGERGNTRKRSDSGSDVRYENRLVERERRAGPTVRQCLRQAM